LSSGSHRIRFTRRRDRNADNSWLDNLAVDLIRLHRILGVALRRNDHTLDRVYLHRLLAGLVGFLAVDVRHRHFRRFQTKAGRIGFIAHALQREFERRLLSDCSLGHSLQFGLRHFSDVRRLHLALAQAQSWLVKRTSDIPKAERDFIVLGRKRASRLTLWRRAATGVVLLGSSPYSSTFRS
jgi:hypothetical protein